MSSGLLGEVATDVERRASEGAVPDEDQGLGFLLQARGSRLELFESMREDILADLEQFPGFVAFHAFATDPDPESETVPMTVMMRFTGARHLDAGLICSKWLAKFARLQILEGAHVRAILPPAKSKTVPIIWIFAQITLLLLNGAGVLPSLIETGLFRPATALAVVILCAACLNGFVVSVRASVAPRAAPEHTV